jgi:F0F1-type ATP synthase alpha subunit
MNFEFEKEFLFFNDIGIVENVSDGIVTISGLEMVANGEMINFCVGSEFISGLVLNLEHLHVSAVVLGSDVEIRTVNMFFVNIF